MSCKLRIEDNFWVTKFCFVSSLVMKNTQQNTKLRLEKIIKK